MVDEIVAMVAEECTNVLISCITDFILGIRPDRARLATVP
jgi:hypothetical protein